MSVKRTIMNFIEFPKQGGPPSRVCVCFSLKKGADKGMDDCWKWIAANDLSVPHHRSTAVMVVVVVVVVK